MSDTPVYRKQQIIGRIAAAIYKLYSATFRYRLHSDAPDELEETMAILNRSDPEPGRCLICAFWHQDELLLLPYFRNRKIVAMVSASKDGTIIATVLEAFGYLTTRGSSSRDAVKAFVATLRLLRKGYNATVAVDGPRGPAFKTKEGAIRLSEKTDTPILPLRAWPERKITFWKAWDQGRVPLPFSRVHVVLGPAGMYSREETDDALNGLTAPI